MENKHYWILRVALIVLAVLLILVPVTIVEATGNGFSALVCRIFLSGSLLSLIASIWAAKDWKNKEKRFFRGTVSIGLLIVLVSLWR